MRGAPAVQAPAPAQPLQKGNTMGKKLTILHGAHSAILAIVLCAALIAVFLTGCGSSAYTEDEYDDLSYEDAVTELKSLLTKIDVDTVEDPAIDIYSETASEADALADIDTFEITVEGNGEINIEIAAATELTSDSPDDWLNVVAEAFNKEGYTIDGKTVTVTVRQITSGEAYTYIAAGAYEPDVFIPSNEAWGLMVEASGISIEQITDRIAGNTAGVLIESGTYEEFIEQYGEATLENILEAAIAGDLTFAYTNPYTSSTGLNLLAAMLKAFDEDNPLSSEAQEKLLEYQQTSPPVAYTTSVLSSQAAKGVINAMVMEEQAYINTAELADYVYIPFGIRHDHPVYTFDWCTDEEQEAAALFVEYCLTDENQELAAEKGFNLHDDYESDDPGLDGAGYIAAQQVWKESKNGGNPIVAVFVADVSGSMSGEPLSSLKSALVSASSYIGSDNYVGLVSYSSSVTINLEIAQFDATQRAYFSGEVNNLMASGSTATYDAVIVALDMLAEAAEEIPDATLMLFVLSDGEQNVGYSINRVTSIIAGMDIPVYTICYNYDDDNGELARLSDINEAAALNAQSDDVVNQLRNLFNVTL